MIHPLAPPSALRILLAGASLVVVTAGLRAFATTLGPILLALLLMFLLLPVLHWLQRLGWRNWVALTTISVVTLLAGVVMIVVLGVSLTHLAGRIPGAQDSLARRASELESWLKTHGIDASAVVASAQSGLQSLFRGVVNIIGNVAAMLVTAVLIVLFALWILIEVPAFEVRFRTALGDTSPDLARGTAFVHSISSFFAAKAVLGLAVAVGDLILLLIVGVDSAVLWAMVSFACSFIPYVGYWIALIPPLLLGWLQLGPGAALVVFLGYWVINGTFDTLIGPRFLGHTLDISPTVTILALVYWSWVLGPVGSLLALPLTVMVKTLLLERDPDTRWLALVMGASK